MDWIVPGVAKSRTQLSNFHFYFFHPLLRAAMRFEGEDRHTRGALYAQAQPIRDQHGLTPTDAPADTAKSS